MKKIKLFLITLLCMVGVMNVSAQDVINSNPNHNVGGHWQWIQEEPVQGNSYKIVNGKTSNTVFCAVGTHERSLVFTTITDAGEWLYGQGGTLTIIDGDSKQIKPIYDGSLSNPSTEWDVNSRPQGGVSGYGISVTTWPKTWYLKAGEKEIEHNGTFEGANGKEYVWNFYSLDQCDCYEDYKSTYDKFLGLYTQYSQNEIYRELYDQVTASNFKVKGNTDIERENAYEWIGKMLDVIASLGEKTGSGGLENPGAEQGKQYWRFRRTATTAESWATATDKKGSTVTPRTGTKVFDLRNATMSQTVTGLEPGVYTVKVYWMAYMAQNGNPASTVVLRASSSADDKSKEFVGSQASATTWQEATLEVVVVDGRLTISATANTNVKDKGWVNLDDFSLTHEYTSLIDDETVPKTVVYKGVFSEGNNVARVDIEHPYADITAAYGAYFKFDKSQNPNGLCYAKSGKVVKDFNDGTVDAVNVVRDGKCANLVLVDQYPYSAKADFTATNASYEMKAVGLDEVTEKKWGSLMLPYDAAIPNGVSAWTLSVGDDGETLNLTPVSNVIPANTAVLVSNTGSFTATGVDVLNGQAGEYKQGGDLTGVYKSKYAPVGSYVLQKHGKRVEYYLVETENLSLVKPFRSYLTDPEGNARSMSFEIIYDETDGISNVEFECEDGAIYDMSGRRVQQLVRGGIYIFNGKKILVK